MYESNDKMVSHPEHYQSKNGLEVIDVIEAFTSDLNGIEATDTGNILKYACRWKRKNGVQDLKKIMWYTQHLIDHLEGSKDHKTDDKVVLNILRNQVYIPFYFSTSGLKVGDKMMIPLGKLGNFMATVQKITDNMDGDEQLPLMKQSRNRVPYYKNDSEFGWLRNSTKRNFSSTCFAIMNSDGNTDYTECNYVLGVRPEFWLSLK